LRENLSFFIPGRAKDLSAPLVTQRHQVVAEEIETIVTETLASFLPGRTKDLSAPLVIQCHQVVAKQIHAVLTQTLVVSFLVELKTYQHPF